MVIAVHRFVGADCQAQGIHDAGVERSPARRGRASVVRWLRWAGIAIAIVVLIVVSILGVGAAIPESHTASVTVELVASPEEVWGLIRDFESSPEWREGVTEVRSVQGADGTSRLVETNDFGTISYRVEAEEPPRRLVTRIVDNTDFGGTWTYELEPEGPRTRLTITEDGEIYNLFFRFVSRFVMGYDATLKGYARSLEARIGPGT